MPSHALSRLQLDAARRSYREDAGRSLEVAVDVHERARAGRPRDALGEADRSVALLVAMGEPNPYLLGMAVLVKVQVLTALGRVDDVLAAGEEALARLGERVPQARSMILGTIASSLRDAGRAEQAYDVLQRCVEVERTAMRELPELQLGLERARIEMELLRDQAQRDPLTGLHNRRYLEQARDLGGPVALAVLDIDHFKGVGVVTAPEAADLGALAHDADARLYAAKRAGRDRAVAA